MNRTVCFLLSFALLVFNGCTTTTKNNSVLAPNFQKAPSMPKNIILMIVDGMGFNHVEAARIYNGMKPFTYEQFPCKASVTTCSAEGAEPNGSCSFDSNHVTDSAAAATAMATGKKVGNGVLSRQLPQSTQDIETILEFSQKVGKSTGVVATKLFSDATPAAFVSHADHRDHTDKILNDIFQNTLPNVVFGADTVLHRQYAIKARAPYLMANTVKELQQIATKIDKGHLCRAESCPRVYGGFGQHDMIPNAYKNMSGLPLEITPAETFNALQVPHLSEMTDAALKILNKNEAGFFLMVESSMPDMISHFNRQISANEKSPRAISVLIREMLEVEKTVALLKGFVEQHPDTLLVMTADHETGGLVIEHDKTQCIGKEACLPWVRWTSMPYEDSIESPVKHTAANVPLYALGKGAERFCGAYVNNIDIPKLALGN